MKTRLLLSFVLVLLAFVQSFSQCESTPAGSTCIPDDNFENYLETHNANGDEVLISDSSNLGDGVMNNFVPTSKISIVTNLDVSSEGISDLTGIDDFSSLIELNCQGNSIETLNLTNNTNLEFLDCYNNAGLSSIILPSSSNALKRLQCYSSNNTGVLTGLPGLSSFTNLEFLWCFGNNINGILDLTANVNLQNVDCGDNNITEINLPDDIGNFTRLNCDNNSIATLDLSQNESLEVVNCNDNVLTSLTMPNAPDLWFLNCSYNQLGTLDLTTLPDLGDLYCNDNMLTGINLSNNGFLNVLEIYRNLLSGLNLSGNPFLRYLDCGINPFTQQLVVTSNVQLQELYCNNINLTNINLTANTDLQYLGIYNDDQVVIDLGYENDISTLNLVNNTDLIWVSCGRNPNLSNVTLPDTSTLKTFWSYTNGLSDISFLNATNRANLEYFDVGKGNLTSIDVSDIPNLKEFYCNDNTNLAYLNIANGFNNNLNWMWAQNTDLSCIQVDNKGDADGRSTNNWRKPPLASYEESCPNLNTEDFNKELIALYPNPTNNIMHLKLTTGANYSLINPLGKVVSKGELIAGENQISVTNLTNGIYFLKVKSVLGDLTRKVLKK